MLRIIFLLSLLKYFNGKAIQEIDNQYYLIFDWIEGRSLKLNEVNEKHSEKIGEILAGIHMTDFTESGLVNDASEDVKLTDWNYYLQKGKENDSEWVNQLSEIINNLYEWSFQSNKSRQSLSSNMVISHRDMDLKNVMWNQGTPIIIDWESAGYINPMVDLVDTAIYWSENHTGDIDKARFLFFINGYKKKCHIPQANLRNVLEFGYLGKLCWLEYSLKRSLWIECSDAEEQKMGTSQVIGTINSLSRYENMIAEIEEWLWIDGRSD